MATRRQISHRGLVLRQESEKYLNKVGITPMIGYTFMDSSGRMHDLPPYSSAKFRGRNRYRYQAMVIKDNYNEKLEA